MVALSLTITGIPKATAALSLLQQGAEGAAARTVVVGASAPYAIYQHEGTRFMTGTHFLTRGLASVQPQVVALLAAALPKGRAAAEQAMLAGGALVRDAARPLARIKTGNLRASLYTRGGR